MTLTPAQAEQWATRLVTSRTTRTCCPPITSSVDLDLDDAYAIQRAVTAIRVRRGEAVVGWKLGYTSLAMRAQMGIDQPNFGPLTDAMLWVPGEATAPLIQPRVEPEIGLRFARPLAGEVTVDDVVDAIGDALACLEVVDSVYPEYRFRLEDNTADGSSAAGVVIGPPLRRTDALDQVSVVLTRNGEEVGTATGSAASGHPAASVVWLVRELARRGEMVRAGELVITGGLTRAVPLDPGDRIEAVFDGEIRVATYRSSR